VTESFGRYISAIYADRFDSYAGQKLQVTREEPAAAGVMVRSQIIKANGEPVNVDYMMRRTGETWLISDIYLDGAISEVATRRSEFAAILKNEASTAWSPRSTARPISLPEPPPSRSRGSIVGLSIIADDLRQSRPGNSRTQKRPIVEVQGSVRLDAGDFAG